MKKLVIIFSVLVALISCAPKESNISKPLIVAMELQFPPFEMTDNEGNPTGISVDFAQALGKHLGREVKIENTAWTGLIPALQTEKVDLIISSMSITEERAKVVDFSEPYAKSGLTLLLNKDTEANSFDDLNSKEFTVAVKMGTIGAINAKNKLPNANIHQFEDVAPCVLEVAQGKADAFIYDALTTYENHLKHKTTTRVNLESIKETEGFWAVAIKKGNTDLKKQVDAFIIEYRKTGGFNQLGEKYLKDIKSVFAKEQQPFFFDL